MSASESSRLQSELAELKARIREARRGAGGLPAIAAPGTSAADGVAGELRKLDKEVAKAKREIAEMKETLEAYEVELDVAQRLENTQQELNARLEKQNDENALLDRMVSRQSQQVGKAGLTEQQKREQKKLQQQSAELHEQLRTAQTRAADLSRQQHQLSLRWSKICGRQERLKRGLASTAAADDERAGGVPGGAAIKVDSRLEHAAKALKVAVQAGVGQHRRHQQRMAAKINELRELRQQAQALGRRVDAEGVCRRPRCRMALSRLPALRTRAPTALSAPRSAPHPPVHFCDDSAGGASGARADRRGSRESRRGLRVHAGLVGQRGARPAAGARCAGCRSAAGRHQTAGRAARTGRTARGASTC